MMKKLLLFLATLFFALPLFAEGPSIALPPAQVILNECAANNLTPIDFNYAKSKLQEAIEGSKKIVFVDARPARNYDMGHIPTAINIYDAKFERLFPEFQKLGYPMDVEIIAGVGRPCPMSLNDLKQFKAKGYTNLKAFVKGPVWVDGAFYQEVTEKGAKKYLSDGAVLVKVSDVDKFLSEGVDKAKNIIVTGSNNPKENYAAAEKIFNAGYKMTFVYNGNL
ncbi:rhodanese-like domain-containing protein [Calditerrivibrio nitroreducens]|uniref:rhodanese-like domain-containing protein n=1 Tax=Calditerrivibrio nitroreducens TaxID=477976 RepID=UPI0002F209B8|nr:rhodanese-like domain-containing protein [Calditerrivibrio nitroreducens]